MTAPATRTARLAIIGVGPTGTAFLERVVANAPELAGDVGLEVHLVDPHPPGPGRVWRHEQSALLWTNSMAEDVTMFTDDSVRCTGPVVPGPTLDEWAATVRREEVASADIWDEARQLDGMSFPTRQLQSAYLAWVLQRIRTQAPANVRIEDHATTVADIRAGDTPDTQVVHLEGGRQLTVDVVVLTLGHLDVEPRREHAADAAFAREHGLAHLPPAYTADVELDAFEAGEPVIVRGLGLAFIDVMVLLTEARGGRFVRDGDGSLNYEPSGREPVLLAGSRRGVPYRSKIGYRLQAPRPKLPRFLDAPTVAGIVAQHERIDFFDHVWPLLAKDVLWGYYHELFAAHAERTAMSWDAFAAALAATAWGDEAIDQLVAAAVPAEADRFDIAALDHPLANLQFATADELQRHVRAHIEADRARRTDPAFSADLGAFYAMLTGFGQVVQLLGSGRFAPRSMAEDANGWWYSFFSYYASGPPAARLDQLLALSRAGVVQFLGAAMWVSTDGASGQFRAGGSSIDVEVTAGALIEARLPAVSVSRTRSPLLRALRDRGEAVEHVLVDGLDGTKVNTGKLSVDPELRVIGADGAAHPRRFALGIHTSRPAAGTFARPRTNALPFRQNDAVARHVLELLVSSEFAAREVDPADDDVAVVA